jgi:hypothetical protein
VKYNQPYGITDPEGPYVNGNPATGTMGSIPPAASIEYPQREIVQFIKDSKLNPTNADLRQLSKSVQSNQVVYGVDVGAVNILSVALNPPLDAYVDGMTFWVRVANDNTGPATFTANALGGRNIVRRGGGVLQPGDLRGGYFALLNYNGPHNNFELYSVNYAAASVTVPILAANTNLYVNTATGNDSTLDGTAPTISGGHGPFKTIQRAVNETFKYGPSIYTMTINVAAGTYNESVSTPNLLGPTMIIKGSGPTSCFVNGLNDQHVFATGSGNTVYVQDLCIQPGTGIGPPSGFVSSSGSLITDNTASRGSGIIPYIFEAYGSGALVYPGNHTFNAGSSAYIDFGAYFGGALFFRQNRVFTWAGTHTLQAACAEASTNGSISVPVPNPPTFNGAGFVVGPKYSASVNGVISVQGLGVNYFPGSVAGNLSYGGQYI